MHHNQISNFVCTTSFEICISCTCFTQPILHRHRIKWIKLNVCVKFTNIRSSVIYSLVRIYQNSPRHTVCYVYYPIHWLIDNPSKFIYPNHPRTIYCSSPMRTQYAHIYAITYYNTYVYVNAGISSWRCTKNYRSCSRFIIIHRSCNTHHRHTNVVLYFLLVDKTHTQGNLRTKVTFHPYCDSNATSICIT